MNSNIPSHEPALRRLLDRSEELQQLSDQIALRFRPSDEIDALIRRNDDLLRRCDAVLRRAGLRSR